MIAAIQCPSPNFNDRALPVSLLVLHYTGMRTGQEALERLIDPAAKVSAHYVVEEDGRVFALVAEDKRAWHAGVSRWGNIDDVNSASIGIEIVNPGHEFGYRPFPDIQMQAVTSLAQEIITRHAIQASGVVGHSDIAPSRKEDPGELFDWAGLADQGVGRFPSKAVIAAAMAATKLSDRMEWQEKLQRYGYGFTASTDTTDASVQAVVTAFQRHFRPHRLNGQWDAECEALLDWLLKAG